MYAALHYTRRRWRPAALYQTRAGAAYHAWTEWHLSGEPDGWTWAVALKEGRCYSALEICK